MTTKVQSIIAGSVSAVAAFIGWFITLTPEQQTASIAPIIALVPVHWQSTIGVISKAVAGISGLIATFKAAQSGPKPTVVESEKPVEKL